MIPRLLRTAAGPFVLAASPLLANGQELVVERGDEHSILRTEQGVVVRRTSSEVSDARLVRGPEGRARVALWNEGSTPWYALDPDGAGLRSARETSYDLHLKLARFDPRAGAPALASAALGGSGELHLVQYVCQPLESFDRALEELGARVHHYVPLHARLVRMDDATAERVAALDFVRWVGNYRPDYRLEGYLLERIDGLNHEGGLRPGRRYNVQLIEKGPALKATVAARIEALGGVLDSAWPSGYLLSATLTPEQLAAVASFDEVVWIDRWSDFETDLNNVRSTGGANSLESLTGYSGEGVRGEVCDSNVRSSHVAFQSNPILHHGGNSGDSDHGTKTTGCVFSDGTANASGRGMLPDGQPIFADFGFLGDRYAHTAQLLGAPYFAVFQSCSWGNATTTQYTSISMEMDDILFDQDLVIAQSQSNTGTQLSRPQAWAKNILSVGGIDHQDTATLADDDWGGIASIGPAADGRVKPDLSFWAESILTTDNESNNDYTTSFGGTSAATPCTAGYVGLVQQMWSEGVFGNFPSGSTVFERRAKATTCRALLINSATQYVFNGTNHDLTRTHQGWGLPGVHTLYARRDETFVVDETDLLGNLESNEYALEVLPGETSIKATLVFNDLPGTTSSNLHRINDLTLKVRAPDGTVYWGNNGLRAGNWSTPGGSANHIDVVENVFVQSPQAGVWTVTVIADELNGDGHVETGALDADYALVVAGVVPPAVCPDPVSYCVGKLTSLLTVPAIGASGTPSVSTNAFDVTVEFGVPDQPAIVFWSDASANTPMFGGTLCVATPLVRGDTIFLDGAGAGTWPIDIGGRTPGDTEYFQVWMRDPADTTGFGVGLSDGLQVTYCE